MPANSVGHERYRVIERLEAGGMAEVFRGEAQSVEGFKKQVAIKRVLPHLAQNRNFIAMFLDEARLGARMNHANVVSVMDIGSADNTFFIVMEFIDGCNLKTVIEQWRQLGKRGNVKETLYIAMEACRGLNYAHEIEDDDGNLLHIVHRDISPPNILLSKRGEVKVTDFGLAKATTQLEKTDPGVVKGKFSYLAPEAALGMAVDARADIFALGVVVWEMLAGRRLFLGDTDYQTVKLVQSAEVPSLSKINPGVDAELEKVLSKALTRNPAERYQTASEFGDALAGYLFGHQMKVTAYDVAAVVKEVLANRAAAKLDKPRDQSIIDRLIQEELLRFTSLGDGLQGDGQAVASTRPSQLHEHQPSSDGAMPLDLFSFENPNEWLSGSQPHSVRAEDSLFPISLDTHSGEQTGGWAERGLALAQADASSSTLSRRELMRSINSGSISAQTSSEIAMPEAEATARIRNEQSHAAPSEEIRQGTKLYISVAAVLLLLAGALAYFGGIVGE